MLSGLSSLSGQGFILWQFQVRKKRSGGHHTQGQQSAGSKSEALNVRKSHLTNECITTMCFYQKIYFDSSV